MASLTYFARSLRQKLASVGLLILYGFGMFWYHWYGNSCGEITEVNDHLRYHMEPRSSVRPVAPISNTLVPEMATSQRGKLVNHWADLSLQSINFQWVMLPLMLDIPPKWTYHADICFGCSSCICRGTS